MTTFRSLLPALLSALLSAASFLVPAARATLLYYDGFPVEGTDAYAYGDKLTNVNPAHASIVGFPDNAANKWSAGTTAVQIHNEGLLYPDGIPLVSVNGELTLGRGNPANGLRGAYRNIVTPALPSSFYVSFLLRFQGTLPSAFTSAFLAFDTHGVSGTSAPYASNFGENGFIVDVRKVDDHAELQLRTDKGADTQKMAVLLDNMATSTTYFIVVKYEKSGGNHVVSASILDTPAEPDVWNAVLTTAARSQVPNKMQIGGWGASSSVNYLAVDEVRIGTAIEDVVGVAGSEAAEFTGASSVTGISLGASAATATFSATVSTPGNPVSDVFLCWGDEDAGLATNGWDHVVPLGTAVAGTTYTHTATTLPLGVGIFHRFAALSELQSAWAEPGTPMFLTTQAPTNVFLGTVSTLASEAGNWTLGHVPTASETVVYRGDWTRSALDWDANAPLSVGTWVQKDGATYVTFSTTPAAPLRVVGDISVEAGVWTHEGPSAEPTAAVAVSAGGDIVFGSAALVNVGTAISGPDSEGIPRGYYRAGPGYTYNSGASYGGEGYPVAGGYGHVLNPLDYGSGARGSGGENAMKKYSGGGLVVLSAGGTLTLNGTISADGYGYGNNGGASSGGTINLTAGQLLGTGTIHANGGTDTYYGSGGGGRVYFHLTGAGATLADFEGTVAANGSTGGSPGGTGRYDTPSTASGTIAVRTAGQGANEADVYVRNLVVRRDMTNEVAEARVYPATPLPPRQNPDASYRETDWHLQSGARLRLTSNTEVRSIEFLAPGGTYAAPVVFTDGFTLRTKELRMFGTRLPPGQYVAANYPDAILGEGSILVLSGGTTVLIR